MSVKIPSNFDFDLDVGMDLDVSGVPTRYTIDTNVAPLRLTLDPMALELKPIELSLRLKEVPAVRMHFPVDYRLGLSVLGAELVCLRLCGQAQTITEPYVANPCELRSTFQRTPQDGVVVDSPRPPG